MTTQRSRPDDDPYGRGFYEYVDESASSSAEAVVPILNELIEPRSVVDVGCGTGAWLAVFAKLGVGDVLGIDSNRVPADLRQLEGTQFVPADLTDLTDLTDLGRTFDLAVCLEVAEHLPESAASTFVRHLAGLAPVVVFSAAIPGQGGEDHINEQWPDYWAQHFAEVGFELVDVLRPVFWDDGRVDCFYRQNMQLYVRADALDRLRLRPGMIHLPSSAMPLVHPVAYTALRERFDSRRSPMSLSTHLRQLPGATARAIRRRLIRQAGEESFPGPAKDNDG